MELVSVKPTKIILSRRRNANWHSEKVDYPSLFNKVRREIIPPIPVAAVVTHSLPEEARLMRGIDLNWPRLLLFLPNDVHAVVAHTLVVHSRLEPQFESRLIDFLRPVFSQNSNIDATLIRQDAAGPMET